MNQRREFEMKWLDYAQRGGFEVAAKPALVRSAREGSQQKHRNPKDVKGYYPIQLRLCRGPS
jgi:hypothetical protein